MEEDVGVKVTTRLRRRLSVEQSEDGSSPAPSTPSKKRGGRLAAKPQLELIDENTPVSSPRNTRRKSLATDTEEKPLTPSRRSARIKSNSSIVSETLSVQATDSPRAKRAARRNSQAGSDNEGPATPARQTRRTRKDSTSSVENQESGTLAKPLPVVEMVIEEEPENEVQKVANKSKSSPAPVTDELSPNSVRKSKRLLEKRRSGSHKSDHDCSSGSVENKSINLSTTVEKLTSEVEAQSSSQLNKSVESRETNEDLSESKMSSVKKLDSDSKVDRSKHNISETLMTALDLLQNDKSKRNRTESWPAITTPVNNDSANFSDNEVSKKRRKSDKIKTSITTITNDCSPETNEIDVSINENSTTQSSLETSSKRKKRQSGTSVNASVDIPKTDETDTSVNEKNTSQSFLNTSSKRRNKQSESSAIDSEDTPKTDKTDVSMNEKNISQSFLNTSTKRKNKQSESSVNDGEDTPKSNKTDIAINEKNNTQSFLNTSSKRKNKQSESSAIDSEDTPKTDKTDVSMNEKNISQSFLNTSTKRKNKQSESSVNDGEDTPKSNKTDIAINEKNNTQSFLNTSSKRKNQQSESSAIDSEDTPKTDKTDVSMNEKNISQSFLNTSTKRKNKQSESSVNDGEDTPKSNKTDIAINEKNNTQSFLNTSSKQKKKQSESSVIDSEDTPKTDKTDVSMNEKNTSHSFLNTSTKRKNKQSESLVNDSEDTPKSDKTDIAINEKNNTQSFLNTSSKQKKKQSESSVIDSEDIPKSDRTDVSMNEKNMSQSLLNTSTKRKKKQSESSVNESDDTPKTDNTEKNISINEETTSQSFCDTSSKQKQTLSLKISFTEDPATPEDISEKKVLPSNKEATSEKSGNTDIVRDITMLFNSTPGNVQATVYFEDSDSNSVGTGAANKIDHLDGEDQCVPVVKHDFQENISPNDPANQSVFSNQVGNEKGSCTDISVSKVTDDGGNNSCEPMDIDETIHEEILQKSLETSQQSKKVSKSMSLSQSTSSMGETDKSRRTSSISNTDTQDRSKNENKSTLILSQIKDTTTTESPRSPKLTHNNEILSKSDINVHKENKMSKGNLSLTELKGTPKPKTIQKLSIQTSTPIIRQQTEVKTKEDKGNMGLEHSKSNFSKSINDADTSEEESGSSDDETSGKKSKLLDDEAEEASDDYESGDSQDDEERRYVAENEIVERGETLKSDDEISNDTEYEKDSFIVSSDADDNELLSGSGDDLATSDNELTMSKKSKNKFNERKLKEQKKASREMFESRHKLNTSDQKSPAKIKRNRMRIDSSLLESDEEVVVKPKKSNRMRLDSTLDTSLRHDDTNVSLKKSNKKNKSIQDSAQVDTSVKQDQVTNELHNSKKKNKSTRESTANKSAIDENEITVCNESTTDNADPLEINVKQEPKTPQKDLDISVVQFTDRQQIENVHVAENISITDQSGSDPLQTTKACEYSSDSSESEVIMQNYDSMLEELNKNKKSKLNNNNASLITGSKAKKNRTEPIIDQLNLTNTKKPKKNSNSENVMDTKITGKLEKKQDSDNEDLSSSIDLQLLFSEDNCGSEDEKLKTQPKEDKADDDDGKMFIPLKKSPGKTNIWERNGMNTSQKNTSLNESAKKKKKRKSSLGPAESTEEQDMTVSQITATLNESSKKKNKHKSSLLPPVTVEDQDIFKKSKDVNMSLNESGTKKKKKLSISEPATEAAQDISNKSKQNISLNESGIKKKKKLSLSEPIEDSQGVCNISKNASLNESGTKNKKKKKLSISELPVEETEGELFFIDTAGTRGDNKDDLIERREPSIHVLYEKKKKKDKSDISRIEIEQNEDMAESNAAVTPKGEKKKKNKITQELQGLVHDDDSDGAPDEAPYLSEKATGADLQNTENDTANETGSGKKKKKKKKKAAAATNQSGQSINIEEHVPSNSKKRKRKSSNTDGAHDLGDIQDNHETGTTKEVAGSHKKKRKILHKEDNDTLGTSEHRPVKKNKKNHDINFQDVSATGTAESQVKKSKKRKHRDEDVDSKQTKVSKENAFQQIHVPRLSDSILNQLDDKPKRSSAANVISTTNFIVEPARKKRAKPSNYLEESIYLDANSPIAQKEKPRIGKPKVLPFIPTASISDSGFTTNFKINKLSQASAFVAEPVYFSKETYLQKKEIKKLGTYNRYKKQMHHKMSKF